MTRSKNTNREIVDNYISNYEYLIESHHPGNFGPSLDVENFCFTLSCCFVQDGVLSELLTPQNIYNHAMDAAYLCSEIEDFGGEYIEGLVEIIDIEKAKNWHEAYRDVYPNGKRTLFHAGLLGPPTFRPYWIYRIGATLIGSPAAQKVLDISPLKPTAYYDWILAEWTFVFKFVTNFHKACSDWLREFDKKIALKGGPSLMETLAVAMKSDEGYETVAKRLKKRNNVYLILLGDIKVAIKKESYREAVTLQENLIAHCLNGYLKEKSKNHKNSSLSYLVSHVLKYSISIENKNSVDLLTKVDDWRKKRNKVIHGGVDALMSCDDTTSPKQFLKEAAEEGLIACQDVCDWYYEEATMFLNLYRDESEKPN